MAGAILGTICGAAELWLLNLLVRGVTQGALKIWVIPANMAVLVVFLVPCALFWPAQLYIAGIAAAAVLIVGSAVTAILSVRRSRKTRELPAAEEGSR